METRPDPMGKGQEKWARPLHELRGLSDAEIIELHDRLMTADKFSVEAVNTDYWLTELQRRDMKRQGEQMVKLTWVIAGLTILNAAFVAISAF